MFNTIIANIPVGRLGQPEEVADAVEFLAVPERGLLLVLMAVNICSNILKSFSDYLTLD
ncbi:hypothetical protein LDG_7058 [Legionella drancourtii LLAP12]|uniref:Uncharacterized protein n=1 Tax=Legionella drancourtii LLAP12 TaxID=658187 RepID=G9EP76_9GAMM|nr:hypothetical protein LDG_7058 [Legionella drancourtii LLAP12]